MDDQPIHHQQLEALTVVDQLILHLLQDELRQVVLQADCHQLLPQAERPQEVLLQEDERQLVHIDVQMGRPLVRCVILRNKIVRSVEVYLVSVCVQMVYRNVWQMLIVQTYEEYVKRSKSIPIKLLHPYHVAQIVHEGEWEVGQPQEVP